MRERTAYTENDSLPAAPFILGEDGRKYCPNDRSLLVYRGEIDKLFCSVCGYSPEDIPEETMDDRNGGVWCEPLMQPRSEITRQRLRRQQHQGYDSDLERLIDAGYTIVDSRVGRY